MKILRTYIKENIGILLIAVAISIIFALIGTISFINRKVE